MINLAGHEIASPGVQKTIKYFQERLITLRGQLEKESCSEADSIRIRGKITEIKDFLRATEPSEIAIRPVAHKSIE